MLIARTRPLCLFVSLRSCLCSGLLSAQSLTVPALSIATVVLTTTGYLLSDNESMPMPGTLGPLRERPSLSVEG